MSDKEVLAREQRSSDLKWLMRTAQFKRFLGRFLTEADRDPWTSDPIAAAYNAGRNGVAREVVRDMRAADLETFHIIDREHRGGSHG